MVTASFPFAPKRGKYLHMGSDSSNWPLSANSIIAGAVATTFVSEARSKTVSSFMRRFRGTTCAQPNAW
jgi:hypothetical protein